MHIDIACGPPPSPRRSQRGPLYFHHGLLAPEKLAGERDMKAWVNSLAFAVPVGVALEGVEGPGAYGLNKQAAVTAIVAKNRRVVANKTYVQGGYSAAIEIIGEAAKLVGGQVPKPEDLLYGPSNADRTRPLPVSMPPGFLYGPLNGRRATAGAGLAESAPGVAETIARAARAQAPEETVRLAVGDLRAWAGEVAPRRRHLAAALERALQGSPSAFARAELSRLKEEMQK